MVFDLCLVIKPSNRQGSLKKKDKWFPSYCVYCQIFNQIQVVWLQDFGFVQLFKDSVKEQPEVFILCIEIEMIYCPLGFYELHFKSLENITISPK